MEWVNYHTLLLLLLPVDESLDGAIRHNDLHPDDVMHCPAILKFLKNAAKLDWNVKKCGCRTPSFKNLSLG